MFIAPQLFAYLDSSQSCATCIKTAGCFHTTWSIDLCHQRYCPHRRRTITGVFTNELGRIPLALQSLRPTQGRLPAVDLHIHLHPWLVLQKLPSPDGGKFLHNSGPAGQSCSTRGDTSYAGIVRQNVNALVPSCFVVPLQMSTLPGDPGARNPTNEMFAKIRKHSRKRTQGAFRAASNFCRSGEAP